VHELSIARSLLELVEKHASRRKFHHVNSLKLSVGGLSCIEPGALASVFEVLAKGTTAQGAALEFELIPGVVYCLACEEAFEVETFTGECPRCGETKVLLTAGTEEYKLIEMEVD